MNDRRENRLRWETSIIKQVLKEAKTGENIIKNARMIVRMDSWTINKLN